MKVVLLGKGEMLANLIEGVLDAECQIVGVFRYERTCTNPFLLKIKDFFKNSNDLTLIKQHKIHEIKCKSANSEEFKKEILKLNVDVVIIGTWGEKLLKETIDLPVIATVNVHPSLLPKYRGPNPYLQTILHGEKKSGLTFHLVNEDFDKGSILTQKEIPIFPNDTSKELKERTVFQARLMCAELLKKLEYGMVIPIPQNENFATYYKNINPKDIMLDFEKETAEQISRRIRAFHPWLPCYVSEKNRFYIPNPYKLKIIYATSNKKLGEIISRTKNSITVLCKDNKALQMNNVRVYGIFDKIINKFRNIF